MRLVYATGSALLYDANGLPFNVVEHQPWDADDPLVKRYPACFTDFPLRVGTSRLGPPVEDLPPVEQATRSPGETRPAVRRAG